MAKKTSKKVTPKKKAAKKAAPKSKASKKATSKKVSPKAASKKTAVSLLTVPATQSVKKTNPSDQEAIRVQAEIVENVPALKGPSALTPVGDGLSSYLANINKYPLLSREQEATIAERYYKDKNPKDAEILVTSNLRFVVKIAAEYSKFGNRLIDLIQEGNVGLMHAVKEFNPYKGARLITYAVWWIRGYIQEYLMRQHSIVRIGTTQNQRKLFYHLRREKEMLDQLGQESNVKVLSARLGIPEDDIKLMEERMSGGDISLDAPIGESGNTVRVDLEPAEGPDAESMLEHRESLQLLEEKISNLRPSLNEKEVYLLEQRLLSDNPITLQDIGTQWGVTREAVRQMEARLMKKIKTEMEKIV